MPQCQQEIQVTFRAALHVNTGDKSTYSCCSETVDGPRQQAAVRVNQVERGSLYSFLLYQNGTESFTQSLACTPHWQPATTDSPALQLLQCSGWLHIKPQRVKTTVMLRFSLRPKPFVLLHSTLFVIHHNFFSLMALVCFPGMRTVSRWAFQGDRASIIQWVSAAPLHSSRKDWNFNQDLPPSEDMNNALCSQTLSQLE